VKPMIMLVRRMVLIASLGWVAERATPASAQTNEAIRIVELSGTVEILSHGADHWLPAAATAQLYPFDRVLTGTNGSVALLWSDQSVLRFGALSELEILPPDTAEADRGLHLIRGLLSFFHRDRPGRIRVITSGALAGIEGTEFVMAAVTNNGVQQTTLSVIDGQVRFSNAVASLVLTNGEQAVAEPGHAPHRTPGFIANNLLQWCFYYPGILDVNDLPLTPAEQARLGDSLAAYRAGDLLAALAKYSGPPDSGAVRVYHAALLLSVGHVERAEADLSALEQTPVAGTNRRLAAALRTLIAAVKREPNSSRLKPELATELLAASYYEQSRDGPKALENALELARRAVTNSPNFGFARERVAELEFSFGRTERASAALNQALRLSPRNAEALALKGFLLAAQNRTREAIAWFDRALGVDSALGNAWLGRGLCRIRLGDSPGGREDLLIAAAMEPQRASLRSYLGKAYGDAGETRRAMHELNLAKQMDTNDPTAWLYSALLNEQNNHINEAIGDLETSEELNDNRSVYRSGLLLDQDHAVRSANLARIYQEDGMDLVSLQEASRAVTEDYANYSAHLFLANSYNLLSDPNEFNLRYQTATYDEYLVGNLLAPASAGVFSPAISQQEYSRLFEQDGFGVISETAYLSRGAWTESGAQYGTTGNFSYDLEGFYDSDTGQRPNNDIAERQLSLTLKEQLTPQDSLFGMVVNYNADGGDLAQYYYQTNANTGLRTHEQQQPLVAAGYHHQWSPGVDTLVLVGRLQDTYDVRDTNAPGTVLLTDSTIDGFDSGALQRNYQSETVIYSAELQQLWDTGPNQLIFGGRFQYGNFKTSNLLSQPQGGVAFPFYFDPNLPDVANQYIKTHMERTSAYGYDLWQAFDSLQLEGGLSYDWITFPEDFRSDPLAGGQQSENRVSPKAGFTWTPLKKTVVQAAYTRSLSGASVEQSFQIEPSQVAGFNQLFRSIIPESIAGENSGARFETYDLEVEQKFDTGTYLSASGEMLRSGVDRQMGEFVSDVEVSDYAFAATTPERLDYQERTLQLRADQLLGRYFVLGAGYRLSDSSLHDDFDAALSGLGFSSHTKALLQQFDAEALVNLPIGFFGGAQGLWAGQSNSGYSPGLPSEDFWQVNLFAGYRSPRRHLEIEVGLLNLTGRDYDLNPLTPYNDLPRSRTLAVQLKLDF